VVFCITTFNLRTKTHSLTYNQTPTHTHTHTFARGWCNCWEEEQNCN